MSISRSLLLFPVAQVRDLARELGTTCAEIVQIATDLGLRATCPRSVLTLEQAENIEAAYWRAATVRVPSPRMAPGSAVWSASSPAAS